MMTKSDKKWPLICGPDVLLRGGKRGFVSSFLHLRYSGELRNSYILKCNSQKLKHGDQILGNYINGISFFLKVYDHYYRYSRGWRHPDEYLAASSLDKNKTKKTKTSFFCSIFWFIFAAISKMANFKLTMWCQKAHRISEDSTFGWVKLIEAGFSSLLAELKPKCAFGFISCWHSLLQMEIVE